ncbi:hypothetical protein FRB99_008247 [Tulasnella sp. 403]|nr:hypothetical protein FRB99_008247 [Tulasnella sp. 403]
MVILTHRMKREDPIATLGGKTVFELLRLHNYTRPTKSEPTKEMYSLHRSALGDCLRLTADNLIRRWLPDVELFRQVLRLSGALVSGSFTLAFIMGEQWMPRDMDIYVGYANVETVMTYLDCQGWHVDSLCETYINVANDGVPQDGVIANATEELEADGQLNEDPAFNRIWGLSKMIVNEDGSEITREINLIESRTLSPMLPVHRLSTSWVQNWMDADSVTILYPDMTSKKQGCIIDTIQQEWLAKYVGRGYMVVGVEDEQDHNRLLRETAMEIKF